MIVEKNKHLSDMTTFKVGGYATNLYIPENENELIEISKTLFESEGRLYIISGGSNLLISDKKVFKSVISMQKAVQEIVFKGEDTFYVGASVRIQKVINYINFYGYGGFEELFCLPAMFGGIVCMNAGIGGKHTSLFSISDFIISVRAYNLCTHKIETIDNKKCDFQHRYSIFKNGKYVILGALIRCNKMTIEETTKRKERRKRFCKENFEYGRGCFGSCFSLSRYTILKFCAYLYRKYEKGIHFGRKNYNWFYNDGNGRYEEVKKMIRFCQIIHHLLFQKIKLEVVIWD